MMNDSNRDMILSNTIIGNENVKHRLLCFVNWLDDNGLSWYSPNMARYRDYLLAYHGNRGRLAHCSINSYLSTVRNRLKDLSVSNNARDIIFDLAPASDLLEKQLFVNEVIERMKNDIHPRNSKVKVVKYQDIDDSQHVRLTRNEVNCLVAMPDVDTMQGLRDLAIIVLMVCTGIRRSELCHIQIDDLRQTVNGKLCLLIKHGKGYKQRAVPYGRLSWCLPIVDSWLRRAGISEGYVFHGVYKGGKSVRPTRITERAINDVIGRYKIIRNGNQVTVEPHDLRRTYSKNLYDSGMGMLEITNNLGHSSVNGAALYIGISDASMREPTMVFEPRLVE